MLLFALLLAAPWLMGAAAPSRDLEAVRKKIASEKKGLSELKAKEGSVLQSLVKISGELGKRNRDLKAADAKLSSIAHELESMRAEAERIARSVALRQEILQRRAVALYRWQRGGSPLTILNGAESLGEFLQRRHYLRAALTFDQELVARWQEEGQRQELVLKGLAEKKTELDDQKQVLGAAKEAVRQEAEKKKVLLASLRQEKELRAKALREMEAVALRLQKMLDELSRQAIAKPHQTPMPSSGAGLEALRGRLEWPVKGAITAPFGKFKHPEVAAEIIRQGIDIDAPFGEAIKAVEKGRVVYANRFAGYGNLVILDHGERYYTIYGHLAEMVKKNGDEVRRGEVLGRVGDSDSIGGAKLYFELRKDGRSVDPVPWLSVKQ